MSIKRTINHRPSKLIGIICLAIGFVFMFLANWRVEHQWGHDAQGGTITFGWSEANRAWLPMHYGTVGIVLLSLGVLLHLLDHHNQANSK